MGLVHSVKKLSMFCKNGLYFWLGPINKLFKSHVNYALTHPLYPMIQPNFYIEELIQNTTSRARMDWGKLTMFGCLQAIPGGVVSREFAEK